MEEVERASRTNRPYAPPSNVMAVLSRWKNRNPPERVTADYLRDCGVPEGSVGRTLFALRFLGLVESADQPSQALRSIATSTEEEYRATLADLVRTAYRDVFDVLDPAVDGQDQLLNKFRRYTPASQRERMVFLFLALCKEAGIPTLSVPKQRGMTPVTSTGTARAKPAGRREKPPGNLEQGTMLGGGSTRDVTPHMPSGLLFGVTEDDIGALDDTEFAAVWGALGTLARARARARAAGRATRALAAEAELDDTDAT